MVVHRKISKKNCRLVSGVGYLRGRIYRRWLRMTTPGLSPGVLRSGSLEDELKKRKPERVRLLTNVVVVETFCVFKVRDKF